MTLERPDLQNRDDELASKITINRKKIYELENKALSLLFSATGCLLDDEELVDTLNQCMVSNVYKTDVMQ